MIVLSFVAKFLVSTLWPLKTNNNLEYLTGYYYTSSLASTYRQINEKNLAELSTYGLWLMRSKLGYKEKRRPYWYFVSFHYSRNKIICFQNLWFRGSCPCSFSLRGGNRGLRAPQPGTQHGIFLSRWTLQKNAQENNFTMHFIFKILEAKIRFFSFA